MSGQRQDEKDLIQTWKDLKNNGQNVANYVESKEELAAIDPSKTDYLLGLFAADHIEYYHEQEEHHDPTLTDMTEKAIQILSKNPNGYFLFVEGGRIGNYLKPES